MKTLKHPITLPVLDKITVLSGKQDTLRQISSYVIALGYEIEGRFVGYSPYESEHVFTGKDYLEIVTSTDPLVTILQKARPVLEAKYGVVVSIDE